jgi:enterochelin esterase family protein
MRQSKAIQEVSGNSHSIGIWLLTLNQPFSTYPSFTCRQTSVMLAADLTSVKATLLIKRQLEAKPDMTIANRVLCIMAAVLVLIAYPAYSQQPARGAQGAPAGIPGGGRGGAAIRSPEVLPDNRVTFRLSAPNAAEVALYGEWQAGPTEPMSKDQQGVWSLTVGPLKPDMYAYDFMVDGVRAMDPQNARYRRAGSRFDSIIIVPGPESSLYEFHDVPHGIVSEVWYKSASLGLNRRMFVYTPPGYEQGSTKYPVMYLLHGAGNDEQNWLFNQRINYILDNLISQGKAKPMIVVMPNGNAAQAASPDVAAPGKPAQAPASGRGGAQAPGPGTAPAGGDIGSMSFPDSIISDIIPYVESRYRTLTDRENRAIVGLSMGGAQALYAGLRNTDKFAWVAGFGGAYVTWPGAMASITPEPGLTGPGVGQALKVEALDKVFPQLTAKSANLRLLYMSVGGNDALKVAGGQLRQWLEGKNFKPIYIETPGYAHNALYWRVSIVDLAPRLFQSR